MRDGATADYRFFSFDKANWLSVKLRGTSAAGKAGVVCTPEKAFGKGKFIVRDGRESDSKIVSEISVDVGKNWKDFGAVLNIESGKKPLYFTFVGQGAVDFMSFELEKK